VVVHIRLLGGFALLVGGEPVTLTPGAERLVAFLTLRQVPLSRVYVAGTLWPDVTEKRSLGNLRSALWRLRRPGILTVTSDRLSLAPGAMADVHRMVVAAQSASEGREGGGRDPIGGLRYLLAGDLLPDWYDDWVVTERERLRELRLHALELLADRFLANRQFALAHEAALAVVQAEPFRESGQIALLRVLLGEGNLAQARRQYDGYRALLHAELGAAPSLQIESLLRSAEALAARR
jgi:DNA-binding SARP family transcriptional activator